MNYTKTLAKYDVTPKLISTTYFPKSKSEIMKNNQLQIKVKSGSKNNTTIIINANGIKRRPILKDKKEHLLFLSLLAEILILIINLILKCYENDYHNSNYLYILFVYAEL